MRSTPHRLLALAALLSALAGCDSGSDDDTSTGARDEAPPSGAPAAEEQVVRDWIAALNQGDYDKAARYFARGAIVDQGKPIKLRDRASARLFNATLPCRADVVEVDDEPGHKALASFRLRAGPGGPCDGTVQVRVTVEDGRFVRWRQLLQEPEPSGPVV